MIEYRSVVDRINNGFQYGHREERRDDDTWAAVLHSDFVKCVDSFWFQSEPLGIMRDYIGFDTLPKRAVEFSQASDSNPDLWYYLAAATPKGSGDEALKWIMSSLAAEAKIRNLNFTDIPSIMRARDLAMFVSAIEGGGIDRTFTKAIMTEMLASPLPLGVEEAKQAFDALIGDPRFKATTADDLEPIVDKVIADNPEQFEKAKTNPKLVQFFVGQVMKATQGKAPPQTVGDIMTRRLAG